MIALPRRGLYAIVDTGSLTRVGISPLPFCDAVLSGGAAVVQLRAKDVGSRDVLALLRALVPRCHERGVPLFVNDRADLAALSGAFGVHVGQSDLSVAHARAVAPGCAVGVSTHNAAQLERALLSEPDYIAVGPVFATTTKVDADPVVGLELLRRAVELSPVPVVAIGGIDATRAREIANAGAMAAVIGALLPAGRDLSEVTERVSALSEVLS